MSYCVTLGYCFQHTVNFFFFSVFSLKKKNNISSAVLDRVLVLPPGPCADSLLIASICKPSSLGLHKHISGADSCKLSTSSIEAASWPFPCEPFLPTSDKHNIKVFFPLRNTYSKDLSCTHTGWEQGWDDIAGHSSSQYLAGCSSCTWLSHQDMTLWGVCGVLPSCSWE